MQKRLLKGMLAALLSGLCCAVAGRARRAVETQLVSVDQANHTGSSLPTGNASLSADGRFVAFASSSPGNQTELLVRDTQSGTTQLIARDASIGDIIISGDGHFAAYILGTQFFTTSSFYILYDLHVRDLQGGADEDVLSSSKPLGIGNMSADGRFIVFDSYAADLVAGDSNGLSDVFVYDRQTRTTQLVSVSSSGVQGNTYSFKGYISANGRFVLFNSYSSNLVAGDTNDKSDYFVRDLQSGTTERVSVSTAGDQGNDNTFNSRAGSGISADGRYVAFISAASNLAPNIPAAAPAPADADGGLFLRDRKYGTTRYVARGSSNSYRAFNNMPAGSSPSFSADGRFLVFGTTDALVPEDTNGKGDIYRIDLQSGATKLVSVGINGAPSNDVSSYPSISADGSFIAFTSKASNLVPNDANNGDYPDDVFLAKIEAEGCPLPQTTPAGKSLSARGFESASAFSPVNAVVVNSTGDGADADPTDGACDADANTPGYQCTLRAAIQFTNARPDINAIVFHIPLPAPAVPSIAITSPLPAITKPLLIDGTSQPCIQRITLNGAGAGTLTNGLNISAGASTVQGLSIIDFSGDGIRLQGAGGNTVQNCFVGTDLSGSATLGNGGDGIHIECPNNIIGGSTTAERNLISGNGGSGVAILGASATANQVLGCFIGTDFGGTEALGNVSSGISILNSGSNIIGAVGEAGGNVLSGNKEHGVSIIDEGVGTATQNLLQNNIIGLSFFGQPLGNTLNGVYVQDAPNNRIGGASDSTFNIISGNRANGVSFSGIKARGNQVLGNLIGTDLNGIITTSPANIIGGAAVGARNIIAGNRGSGVSIIGAAAIGTQVLGNSIGLNKAGSARMGNGAHGVFINGTPGLTIGGATATVGAGPGNILSGNTLAGVFISGATAVGNKVQGNLIGTDKLGKVALGNLQDGVRVASKSNVIGGMLATQKNVIAANTVNGILISGAASSGNQVLGNLIGSKLDGITALGNGREGVFIDGAPSNIIGGTTALARNIIAGTGLGNTLPALTAGNGVHIRGAAARSNSVLGNLIGVNKSGILTAGLGNARDGVLLEGAPSNIIGGPSVVRQVISGNAGNGVEMSGAGASGNQVLGCIIGLNVTGGSVVGVGGKRLGNGRNGVLISGASGNTIGGASTSARNIISGNGIPRPGQSDANGIQISGASATRNLIAGNTIGTDITGRIVDPTPAKFLYDEAYKESDDITEMGNFNNGIWIDGAPGNIIGGAASAPGTGPGNLIAGNGRISVHIVLSNVQSGSGVLLSNGATRTLVQGNIFGLASDGRTPRPNVGNAVCIQDAPGNLIGGVVPSVRNILSGGVIAYNTSSSTGIRAPNGVAIFGARARGNQVQGNFIGTDITGTFVGDFERDPKQVTGNIGSGVRIQDAPDNLVGGTMAGARNLIAGNTQGRIANFDDQDGDGIYILGIGAKGNTVQGNFVGVNLAGTQRLSNPDATNGVSVVSGASNTLVGGVAVGARNVLGLVHIDGSNNQVQGNLIGVNATGTATLGTATSSTLSGTRNVVGGTTPAAANLIAGEQVDISVGGTANKLQGNFLGTRRDGKTALDGVESRGVALTSGEGNFITNNTIAFHLVSGIVIQGGDNNVIQSNTIFSNGSDSRFSINYGFGTGIFVEDGTGNTLRTNSIFNNARLGIDISPAGVNTNDFGDLDTGPNNRQNYPVLGKVEVGSSTKIVGSLESQGRTTFRIEFFSNSASSPSSSGQGKTFLAAVNVTSDLSGRAVIEATLPRVAVGTFITATATDLSTGDTSEFARAKVASVAIAPSNREASVPPASGASVSSLRLALGSASQAGATAKPWGSRSTANARHVEFESTVR